MSSPSFAAVTALSPDPADGGPAIGRHGVEISPEWTIGGRPNGGYLTAMLARAAVRAGTHPHVLAVSAHFLRPPEPGPAWVEAEVLRAGRSASQVRSRLGQGEQSCVEALVTVGRLEPGTSPHWAAGLPPAPSTPREECVRLPARTPLGLPVAIMDQVDLRIDPATLTWATGAPSGAGELRGWLALPGDEPFDPISLVYAVDAFPPATFDIEPTGWVPTLELTVYVRAQPEPGPVRVLQRAGLVEGQRVDESCFVWDRTGRLVAQGTQLAAIRLG